MSWLSIAIIAYLINAVVSVTDKFLVSKEMPNAAVYTFYVGILSFFAICFAPMGFSIPPINILIFCLVSGGVFLFALYFFFIALNNNEASRVIPIIGGLTPVFILLFSALYLKEALNIQQAIAFILLFLGSIIISLESGKLKVTVDRSIAIFLAALLFAVSFVSMKLIYMKEPFWNGFIWSRMGSFLAAFAVLLFPQNRRAIFERGRKRKKSNLLLVWNKALAGLHFVFLNRAISKGSVTLVNAVQGIQYAFVFLIMLALSFIFPSILNEELSKQIIVQKLSAILLIGLGLAMLSL